VPLNNLQLNEKENYEKKKKRSQKPWTSYIENFGYGFRV
jgi:hypothetical protein